MNNMNEREPATGPVDEKALDGLSVVPAGDPAESGSSDDEDGGRQRDAGHDESIAERLQRDPSSSNARLDRALDESMDASDPPASTQPVHNHGPAPSSGYDEAAEAARQGDAQ